MVTTEKPVARRSDGTVIFSQGPAVGTKLTVSHGCEFVHLSIKKEGVIATHQLPMPVSFFVISGSGRLELGETGFDLGAGDVASAQAGVPRSWVAREDLEVLVIKHLPR